MRVLILSTFAHRGGAAIAAYRLSQALKAEGVEVDCLYRQNLRLPFWKEKWGGVPFLIERFRIWVANGFRYKGIFAVDIANCGDDIINTEAFRKADVIHLHWVNQGFLSLSTLEKILTSGKRVVWTMHDQWPLTAVCHYSDSCEQYKTGCKACRLLGGSSLIRRVYEKKQTLYAAGGITFVTCSEWLGRIARESMLGTGQHIVSIPNTIDQTIFKPMDRQEARRALGLPTDRKLILFGCQSVTDSRKGFSFLLEALSLTKDVGVVLVGGNTAAAAALMPQETATFALGQINDVSMMAKAYAAVDAFVTPSLQDNLPNTIMEAMACGTPCVGFDVGGIPEMIDHEQNGYVAEYKNPKSLAEGIAYVTDPANAHRLSAAAKEKVERCYSWHSVAEKHIAMYNEQCTMNN